MQHMEWERLVEDGESEREYRFFCAYRDLDPSIRSMDLAAEQVGISAKSLYRYAKKYRWKERTKLYADYLDRQARKNAQQKAERVLNKSMEASEVMLSKAQQALDALDVSSLSPREVREFAKTAVAIAGLVRDNKEAMEQLGKEDTGAEVFIYLPELEGNGDA